MSTAVDLETILAIFLCFNTVVSVSEILVHVEATYIHMLFDYSDHHGDYVTWIVRTDNERWISSDNKRGFVDAKKRQR